MPGLVGLITKLPRHEAERQLEKMLATLHREDFYSSGTWIDETQGLYLGWTAPRQTFTAGMPLVNEKKDLSLIFSGHEYSGCTAARSARGATGTVDCTYLLRKYEQDSAFFASLNGMFHGIVVDQLRGEIALFNDRYGMHRLSYYEAKDGFYFGAEAKAILAVCPETREPSYRSLGEFASFSCVLENRTIFKAIQVLPGASVWRFRKAQLVSKARYFEPREWEEQPSLSPAAYHDELRSTLVGILPRYFAEQQQIGLAITGGFDTRLILACHPPAAGTLPCYTFGGPFRESQDVLIGRRIADLCQQSHQEIEVGEEFLRGFPAHARRTVSLTEGTVDVGRADYYLSMKARAIAPAKIVGTYGSEVIRHAVMFKPVAPEGGVLSPDFLPYVREAACTYNLVRQEHPVTFAAFRQSPWYHHGVLALEKAQLTVHSPFMDNDFVRNVYRAPSREVTSDDIRLRLIRDANPGLGRVRSDRGLGGDTRRAWSAIINAFLEFTFKAEYAYDYGMPQWVSRVDHSLSALHLERLFLGRHKFLHFRIWYRDQLAGYVREVLLDPVSLSRPYLQKRAVETAVKRHLKGDGNYTTAIHRLLTMELLHRLCLDGI